MIKPILVVDDDEDDVFFLTHALQKCGVVNPIQAVSDGQQAIDYFKGAGKFADRTQFPLACFVFLDLKLPYWGGLDVLKCIRQEAQLTIPVVIFTSSESEAELETAYRLGANAYVVKPTEASKRLEIAKAIKEFWFTNNRTPSSGPGSAPVG